MKAHHPIAAFALLLVFQGCNTLPRETPALEGTWRTTAPGGTSAELLFRPDGTFHVDLMGRKGIEVEGTTEITGDTVRFINTHGTDAVSSDSAPGTYRWEMDNGGLVFVLEEDPLERRARMLALPWKRID